MKSLQWSSQEIGHMKSWNYFHWAPQVKESSQMARCVHVSGATWHNSHTFRWIILFVYLALLLVVCDCCHCCRHFHRRDEHFLSNFRVDASNHHTTNTWPFTYAGSMRVFFFVLVSRDSRVAAAAAVVLWWWWCLLTATLLMTTTTATLDALLNTEHCFVKIKTPH